MPPWEGIVGKRFSPDEFEKYVAGLDFLAWRPEFVVLHNTAEPTLADWPEATGEEHMRGLESYYQSLGWHAGPHLFVAPEGIWVFSPLTKPGVHSPSWNEISWGVEMVGDYSQESFTAGPGADVAHNAICAVATLDARIGLDSATLKFHRMDPKTTHKGCPGDNVVYGDVVKRVHDLIEQRRQMAAR